MKVPTFCPRCGADEYICQRCGLVFCSEEVPTTYVEAAIVAGKRVKGNLCPGCAQHAEAVEPENVLEGVVVFFSRKPKWKRGRYGPYALRYMSLGVGEKEYLISITEKNAWRMFGQKGYVKKWLAYPKSGSIVKVMGAEKLDWEPDWADAMYKNPDAIVVIGHLEKESTEDYDLGGVEFFDDKVILQNESSKSVVPKRIWDMMTEIPTRWLLNKVREQLKEDELKEAKISIRGLFRVYYRYVRGTGRREWLYSNGDNWSVLAQNLLRFKEYVGEYEAGQRLEKFLKTLKALIKTKWMITEEELRELLVKEGVEDLISYHEAQNYLRTQVWHGEYDEAYFEFLKKHGELVGISEEGFFFKLKGGYYAFETPSTASATYIFMGEPKWILSQLEVIKRQSDGLTTITEDGTKPIMTHVGGNWRLPLIRMKKQEPEEFKWFIERAIHDEDASAWHSVVDKYVEGE